MMSILKTRAFPFGRDGSPSRPPGAMSRAAVSAKPPYHSPRPDALLARGMPAGHPCLKTGFTLIEMLIVIGILSVLLGLLYGALERARKFSRYTIAYQEVKQLQAAFEQYYAHYNTWPVATNSITLVSSGDGQDVGFLITREIADALQGVSKEGNTTVFDSVNPDGIPFIEFQRFNRNGDPINPFKANSEADESRCFWVFFDTSGNRQINIPQDPLLPSATSTTIVANVAIWTVIPGFRTATGGAGSAADAQPTVDRRLGSWDSFDLQR